MVYINIERYGQGERVFVGYPGWGADHTRSFQLLLEHLPEDTTFYAMNLPGLGGSEELDRPLSRWRWSAITEALLRGFDSLKLDVPVTLVGSCSGSYHALETAMRRPDMAHRVVMLEPFSYFPWFLRALVLPAIGPMLYNV
ncbi:MAG: alpha/beta hydrolase, partial [Myxococcota bacterium]